MEKHLCRCSIRTWEGHLDWVHPDLLGSSKNQAEENLRHTRKTATRQWVERKKKEV